jgi:hypothetical protein
MMSDVSRDESEETDAVPVRQGAQGRISVPARRAAFALFFLSSDSEKLFILCRSKVATIPSLTLRAARVR